MFGLEDKYKIGKKIPMKDFIPKEIKPEIKKKIKDSVKKAVLTYQVVGEELPSVIDSTYRYQAIQFYDFEMTDIKKAGFVANIYQEIIKSPCVLRLHDSGKELYSLALKRLSKTDETQIVVTDVLITEPFQIMLPDVNKDTLIKAISYPHILNKENKVTFYLEMYVKAYILQNDKVYAKSKSFLAKPVWYDENKVRLIHSLMKNTADNKERLLKASTAAEKMKLNQEIRRTISELDKI